MRNEKSFILFRRLLEFRNNIEIIKQWCVYSFIYFISCSTVELVVNIRPYNLYCVGADVKPCTINNQSIAKKVKLIVLFMNKAVFTLRTTSDDSSGCLDARCRTTSDDSTTPDDVVRCRAQCEHSLTLPLAIKCILYGFLLIL